jgi:hypothetical protein
MKSPYDRLKMRLKESSIELARFRIPLALNGLSAGNRTKCATFGLFFYSTCASVSGFKTPILIVILRLSGILKSV